MINQQKDTQNNASNPCENMPFAGMMQKMMRQPEGGCGCGDMMSQMMAMCCPTQEKGGVEDDCDDKCACNNDKPDAI